MHKSDDTLSFNAAIIYMKDGREFAFSGRVDLEGASVIRKGDQFVPRAYDELYLCSSTQRNKLFRLQVRNPLNLPSFLADLALRVSDDGDDESQGDFERRLSLRDDLATEFEKAAKRLRTAPRR